MKVFSAPKCWPDYFKQHLVQINSKTSWILFKKKKKVWGTFHILLLSGCSGSHILYAGLSRALLLHGTSSKHDSPRVWAGPCGQPMTQAEKGPGKLVSLSSNKTIPRPPELHHWWSSADSSKSLYHLKERGFTGTCPVRKARPFISQSDPPNISPSPLPLLSSIVLDWS